MVSHHHSPQHVRPPPSHHAREAQPFPAHSTLSVSVLCTTLKLLACTTEGFVFCKTLNLVHDSDVSPHSQHSWWQMMSKDLGTAHLVLHPVITVAVLASIHFYSLHSVLVYVREKHLSYYMFSMSQHASASMFIFRSHHRQLPHVSHNKNPCALPVAPCTQPKPYRSRFS